MARRRGDILSASIQARLPDGKRLSREEIVGEVIQMLYAGHLTIPSSLVHFWRDIAVHDAAPELQPRPITLARRAPWSRRLS